MFKEDVEGGDLATFENTSKISTSEKEVEK